MYTLVYFFLMLNVITSVFKNMTFNASEYSLEQ